MKIAAVPASLRMLARKMAPLRVVLRLGPDALMLDAIPPLLKLALLEPQALEADVASSREGTSVRFERGSASYEPHWEALRGDLNSVLADALAHVLEGTDLVAGAHAATVELARLAGMRAVVGTMLAASTLDKALQALLAGVTAGSGLGFHRAALFVRSKTALSSPKAFAGFSGVGPADAGEAHRIWESLEAEEVSFEAQLERAGAPSRFCERVRLIELGPGSGEDEVALALEGRGPIFQRPDGPRSAALRKLDPAAEFVLVRLSARDHVLGLLFADRRFDDGGIDPGLVFAIETFMAEAGLVWETLRLLREVEELARYDSVTGLLNRREFESRFAKEQSRAQRKSGGAVSLLLADLDHFRDVNNEKGHAAGDGVLRMIGTLLRAELRVNDIAARFGGDELVVVLPGAGPLEAATVARRIGVAAHRRGVSISIGSASFPDDCDHPDDLVAIADKNLYVAKNAGRGRACLGADDAPIVFSEEEADGSA